MDPSFDLMVENLTLSTTNLLPNIIAIEVYNFIKFLPFQTIQDESHHQCMCTMAQMQTDMRNIMFYFKKMEVPHMSDSDVADVVLDKG